MCIFVFACFNMFTLLLFPWMNGCLAIKVYIGGYFQLSSTSIVADDKECYCSNNCSDISSLWRIPWMEEPGGLQSMGSQRVRHDWATSLSLFTFMHWRKKWQPTPVFLPGESQGWRSLAGCHLGSHRVGHYWSDLAAAAAAESNLDCSF